MAALPTHETLPADHKAAIRQMKQALRAQIGDVQAVFDKLSARISERLQEIETLKAAGRGLANHSVPRYRRRNSER